MRRRHFLWLAPLVACGGVAFAVTQAPAPNGPKPATPIEGKGPMKPPTKLPITQVVLFNSGVGFFARSGEVEGDARVDLTFPETDINDLLKSMTLQDLDKGRIESITYDAREPISRTLASFAVNLSDNPTMAQILTQARGERVEVALPPTAGAASVTVAGTIVSLETHQIAGGKDTVIEVEVVNLLTAEGLRAVRLNDVVRIKFTNPQLESELKRALDVLALSHDTAKKSVSLNFAGEGKRRVKVSYVVEAPIWKTSYRLVLDKETAPFLQGWAVVENPTDEDWGGVRMALVSGRPISFKMDLYNPLYVPRPTVEPELFASLRPPTYDGGFGKPKPEAVAQGGGGAGIGGGSVGGGGFGGAAPGAAPSPAPMAKKSSGRASAGSDAAMKDAVERGADKLSAQNLGRQLSERMDLVSVSSAATASQLGDFYQYLIEAPVTLARQKSALLPIVNKPIEGTRVSIYNAAVQPKHPLLGLKFKNTTGGHLSQGPVTVIEGSTYAGDARVPDTQPNEERLIAYAIDLGTEVIPQNGSGTSAITSVKADKGVITTVRKLREVRDYKIVNRSATDRVLLIEHPNRTNQGYKVVETPKASEETADLFRFTTPVAAGKSSEFKVTEERDLSELIVLGNAPDDRILYFIALKEVSPALKAKLKEALAVKAKWDDVRRDLQQVQAALQAIAVDQDRLRKNLKETPKEAPVFDTWLKKLSDQEKEIDTLTAKQKQLVLDEATTRRAYEAFVSAISE